MSKRKRPERPQARFSASKNSLSRESTSPEAEPRHRLRDEKSVVSPLDALRKAQELSEKPSDSFKEIIDTPVTEESKQALEPTPEPPAMPIRVTESNYNNPETNPTESIASASFNIGQSLSESSEEELPTSTKTSSNVDNLVEQSSKTTEPTSAFHKPVEQEQNSDFIDHVASPFNIRSKSLNPEEKNKMDKLFADFIKSTENDGYEPIQSYDESQVEPLLLERKSIEHEDEDDLFTFKRLTPEIDDQEPDFTALHQNLLENTKTHKPKIRRTVFQDIRKRGSKPLPLNRVGKTAVISSMVLPDRKLSPERYLEIYASQSSFPSVSDKGTVPLYKRRISASLRQAILEDRPHYSEYNQPESYDTNQPLPELIDSDFIEEGVPEVFIEGGPSVEEVLKAKRASRRDSRGNIRKDLTSADFVEEAFGDIFIEYAEKHKKSYEQLKAPVSYSLDDDLLDWIPVLPPSSPVDSHSQPVPAGIVVEDLEYDLELSHTDYVDPAVEGLPEPQSASPGDSYRELYMESLDPDLFLAELFEDGDSISLVERKDPPPPPVPQIMSGVPGRAEGVAVLNKGWAKFIYGLNGGAIAMIFMIAFFGLYMRGVRDWILLLSIVGGAVLVAGIITMIRVRSYKKVVVDFENQTIRQGRKTIPFHEAIWGEGSSYNKATLLSPKVLKLGKDKKNSVKIILEQTSFKIPSEESSALIDLINQTGLSYSSETDLEDVNCRTFVGTKRNLNMLVNSTIMN